MERGASSSLGFYDAAILNGGAFLGCFALGLVADSGLGIFNSVVAATFACGVVAFAWIGAHNNTGVIVWAVAYGIVSGALQAIFSPCVSELAPTPEVIGSWNGRHYIFFPFCTLLMGVFLFLQEYVLRYLHSQFLQLAQLQESFSRIPEERVTYLCNYLPLSP